MKRLFVLVTAPFVVAGVLTFAAAAWSQGSTTQPPAVSDAEVQTLRDRAAAYWAARMAGDDERQWELLEPRGRGRVTAKEYAIERSGLRYLGYQVEDATVKGYFAVVKVRLLFQPTTAKLANIPVQTVLMDDRWIRVGGSWYRQLDDRQSGKPTLE